MHKIIYYLFRLLPLKKRILLESHPDLSDNSRVLYEYMLKAGLDKEYRFVWFVEKMPIGKKAEFPNTSFLPIYPKSIIGRIKNQYVLSTSQYAFFSHRTLSRLVNREKALFVNLWHGAGPKNPSYMDLGSGFDFVFYPSPFFKDGFVNYLSCKSGQLLPYGNIRNDLLFRKTTHISRLYDRQYKKVIIWMPTFRKNIRGREDFEGGQEMIFGVPLIYTKDNLEVVNDQLKQRNILLVIKLHPAQEMTHIQFMNLSNIRFLSNDELEANHIPLYELLGEADSLLTDYSSVYVDYLLLNRPMGFVFEDNVSYKTGYLFEDPFELMPGHKIYTYSQLFAFFDDIVEEIDSYNDQRLAVNDKLNYYKDEGFAKRVVDDFIIKHEYTK